MPVASVIILHSIDRSENRYRAYTISLEPTLFGDVALVTRWGRLHSKGQQRIYQFKSVDEALEKADRILDTRRDHGYEIVAGQLHPERWEGGGSLQDS